ncbi:DUF6932 family protein [Thalassospira sp. SM2505]
MIPDWNLSGLIPPIRPGEDATGTDRSPYNVGVDQLIDRFCTSQERKRILEGLINYRIALYRIGIKQGFQWLDGSFMEDVESLQDRSPNDIDVVTFFELPAGETQRSLLDKYKELFWSDFTKKNYLVDAYVVVLSDKMKESSIRQVSYWYSMWSHTRSQQWKGFLRVGLNTEEDDKAFLDELTSREV